MRGVVALVLAGLLSGCLASTAGPSVQPASSGNLLMGELEGERFFANVALPLAPAPSRYQAYRVEADAPIIVALFAEMEWDLANYGTFVAYFLADDGRFESIFHGLEADGAAAPSLAGDGIAHAGAGPVFFETPDLLARTTKLSIGKTVGTNATRGTLIVMWANLPGPIHGEIWLSNGTRVMAEGSGEVLAYEAKHFKSEASLGTPLVGMSRGTLTLPGEYTLTSLVISRGSGGTGALELGSQDFRTVVSLDRMPNGTCVCYDRERIVWGSSGTSTITLGYVGPSTQTRVFVASAALDPAVWPGPRFHHIKQDELS